MNYYGNMGGIKIWIIIANIFGIVSGVVGLIAFFAYMQLFIDNNTFNTIPIENYGIIAILGAITTFISMQTIIFGIYLINFLVKNSDEEISNNRYILAALSLTVGGIFTPFILARLRSENVVSTIAPRFSTSRAISLHSLIGGVTGLIVFFGIILGCTSKNGLNLSDLFNSNANEYVRIGSIVLISFLAGSSLYGLLSTLLFFQKNAYEKYNNKNSLMNFLGYLNAIVITFELIIMLIWSVIRIISLLIDIFANGRERGILFGMLNAIINLITIISIIFVMWIIVETIKGMWTRNNEATIVSFKRMEEMQNKRIGETSFSE
ncbi:hypothetical protein [Spiroplasma endosymbiont of Labia minor]|uniref:hypothetical protein n=1 Tax=Spiroplasma endosymbiont of Labia minor TaxID=3066305 RepID=UPI0030CE6584